MKNAWKNANGKRQARAIKKIDIDVEDIKTNDNKLLNECILEIRLFVYI